MKERQKNWYVLILLALAAGTWAAMGLLQPGAALAQGTPANPILVLVNSGSPNPFGRYVGEILRTEGFNEFQIEELSTVDAAYLNSFDLVLLAETPLTAAEVTMLDDYVSGGGGLIAFRPDEQLATLFGLTAAAGTTSEGYLLVDTGTTIGQGIVAETLQFHGTADHYDLAGATSLANLYSDATTPTSYPAIALSSRGSGQAVVFAYDLARSVIYTRQGNPAWAGQEGDGAYGIRASDMFVGRDGEPNWIDNAKVHIPQADEQMRLLSHAIEQLNAQKRPLPRLWYFPGQAKGVLLMTGDSEGCGTACVNVPMQHVGSYGGYYTAYLLGTDSTPDAVAGWVADGHEVAVHYNDTGEAGNPTWDGMWAVYDNMTQAHIDMYGIAPRTVRNHWIVWVGWSEQAEIELAHGIQLDTNYYHWGSWLSGPGHFTGSGLPMKFSDENGQVLDIYQANTQLPDETWGVGIDDVFQTLIDRSIDEGAYSVLTANFHPPNYGSYQAAAGNLMAYANSRGVPIWSAEMLLDFLQERDAAHFSNIHWDGVLLTFDFGATGGQDLTAMIPALAAGADLQSITSGGSPVAYTIETIAGRDYALFDADTGTYAATYAPDTTAPIISDLAAAPGSGGTAAITWTTDEASDSRVDYGAAPGDLSSTVTDAALVTSHSITLSGLAPNTTYYYRVTSADPADNASTSPPVGDSPASFTMPSATFVDTTVVDFGGGTLGTCAHAAETGNGEVILAPAVGAEFSGSALPVGWSSTPWASGGTATVAGGSLTVDGTMAQVDTAYGPGRAIEFVATFQAIANQHIGFGVDFTDTPWAIFSTYSTGGGLYARTRDDGGVMTNTPLPGIWLDDAHHYRIEWTASSVVFYIDGAQQAVHTVSIANEMSPLVSDLQVGTLSLEVDWLRMSPYAASCSFASRVFDAAGQANWGTASWTSDEPAGTSLALSVRLGDSPIPDATWTDFVLLPGPGSAIGGSSRYIQYQADLATTDPDQTPVLEEVTLGYNLGPDVVPPTIMDRSPDPDATDVPLDASITVQFSESMDSSTITASTFRLRASGASSDVAASISYADNVATLEPADPLALGASYNVTVAGSVADLAGNPLGVDDTWTFTATSLSSFVDTTVADFQGGALDANTYVAQTDDGEMMLAPTVGAEFSGTALPAGWSSTPWASGGTATVADGSLTVDGTMAQVDAAYGPGHALEFVATFGAVANQHVGFGVNFSQTPWAIFSTYSPGGGLYARTRDDAGLMTDTPLSGSWLGSAHHYRIEWTASGVVFYVDGIQQAAHTVTIADEMSPLISDYIVGGSTLSADWLRMSPYAPAGTFVPALLDEFEGSGIDPGNWTQGTWPSGGTVVVSGGHATVTGAYLQSVASFSPERVLEGRVQFGAAPYEVFGFATALNAGATTAWAMFSTYDTGSGVYARTMLDGSESDFVTLLPTVSLGAYHDFRIVWGTSTVEYYVDDQLRATHQRALPGPMPAWLSSYNLAPVSADWVRVGEYEYSHAGTFVSRIFDAGETVTWYDLAWTASQPAGTSATFGTRTSANAIDWSPWEPVGSPIASPEGRYFQYQMTLATSDPASSPVVEAVTVGFTNEPTAVTLASFTAEPGPGQITLAWETVLEADTLGFHIYRSETANGSYTRLNESLIPGHPSSMDGAAYTWVDGGAVPGIIYYYQLEEVDVYGRCTRHGPVSAIARPPASRVLYLPLLIRH